MNIALVIAGGSGTRMGQDVPKQFLIVKDTPILIYTLEGFQRHPQVLVTGYAKALFPKTYYRLYLLFRGDSPEKHWPILYEKD